MGSGHILVYAFEVFLQLYEAEGESTRNAVEIILEKNLFGLDIDKRAFQLAYFALMMKGRQYNRRFLTKNLQSNVYQIPDNFGISESELQLVHFNFPNQEKGQADLALILETFKMSPDLGSLISFEGIDFENLNAGMLKQNVSFFDEELKQIIQVAELLQMKYTIAITNPPYMGASGFNPNLSKFSKLQFPDSKADLFAMFIERWNNSIVKNGYSAMVTMQSWMFLSSYEKMREKIIANFTISNLMHMENMVMGIAFGTAVSIFFNGYIKGYKGTYHQIKTVDASQQKKPLTVPITGNRFNQISQDEFKKIPGSPISYWVSENIVTAFKQGIPLGNLLDIKRGMTTSDNNQFLRLWSEVEFIKVSLHIQSHEEAKLSGSTWFPYSKGGGFRKWYGYNEFVVNWKNEGEKIIDFAKTINKSYTRTIVNIPYYFKPSVGFSYITSGPFSMRWIPEGFIYDSGGPGMFGDEEKRKEIIGFMNSKPAQKILKILSPTINLQIADIIRTPYISKGFNSRIKEISAKNIELSKNDWDSFENSWDFKKHFLI